MEIITSFVLAYKDLLVALFFVTMTIVLIYKYWESVKFWWLNTTYSFPVIGKINRLSKDTFYDQKDKMYYSERTLCSDYSLFYDKNNKDANFYDNCRDYLDLLGETKRRPLPIFLWILLAVLVYIEAMGFSYVLSGFTLPGASEDMQQVGALGIAFLVSSILVAFTHFSGGELYHNSFIHKIRHSWQHDTSDKKRKLEPDNFTVILEKNSADSESPRYIRLLNRIEHNGDVTPTKRITFLAAIFIVLVAIGATYVRGEVLKSEILSKVTEQGVVDTTFTDPFDGDRLPSITTKNKNDINQKIIEEEASHDEKGGWATFVVLAVIFIFLQILGIIVGYKWGFAGEESKEAYAYIKGFSTKNEFVTYYRKKKDFIMKVAEQKLRLLQQKLHHYIQTKSTDHSGQQPAMTFQKYLELYQHDSDGQ